jgi:predicted acyl esterase
VRVDVRGSGDSDGLLADEYTEQEQEDALAVIAWIAGAALVHRRGRHARQVVGRHRALRIAARRPPALRAVVTVCSTTTAGPTTRTTWAAAS